MRLHVDHPAVVGADEGGEGAHLVENVGLDFVRRSLDRAPAESPEIVVAGMGADRDPAFYCQPHRAVHDDRIAGVETAGHVRRGDDLEDLLVAPEVVIAEAFAHVTVEVDAHTAIVWKQRARGTPAGRQAASATRKAKSEAAPVLRTPHR